MRFVKNNFFSRQTITQASILLISATFIGRIFGFFREVMVAKFFGASATLDAYLVAFTIPALLISTSYYATSNAFIPKYIQYTAKNGQEKSNILLNRFLSLFMAGFIIITCLIILEARKIVLFIAPGLGPQQREIAVRITTILAPAILFGGIETLLRSLLFAQKHFFFPAVNLIFFNIVVITAIFAFHNRIGIDSLAYGITTGFFLRALFLCFVCRKRETRFTNFSLKLKDSGLLLIIGSMSILIIIEIVGQSYILIDRFIGSYLVEGSISALNYAYYIFQIPIGILGLTIATVILPTVSDYSAQKNRKQIVSIFSRCFCMMLFLFIPITAFLICFSQPIITLFYQRGLFTLHATEMTSSALVYFSVGLLFFAEYGILTRIFYALHKTIVVMVFSICAIVLKFILSWRLSLLLQHNGLALSTSIVGIFLCVCLIFSLHKEIGAIDGKKIATSFLKISTSALISSAASVFLVPYIFKIRTDLLSQIVHMLTAILIFMVIFFISAKLLHIDEMNELENLFVKIRSFFGV